ncbi:MAG: AarF/UbiB family protein [Acidimicrobiales bacterium]|nr:AarF/UbiB family protein [Acidimicrobiales bacterium]
MLPPPLGSSPVDRSGSIDLRRLSPLDAARLVEIAVVLARHGVVAVARRGPLLVIRPRQLAPRTTAVALRRAFVDLGPTFVKLGQLIASSPGLFPVVLSDELRRLLDNVPPEPVGRIRAVIEHDFGVPVDALFAHFDDEPVAAASVAQVHRAVLTDGTEVAVKVRRPRLRRTVERDLRLLKLLAGILGRLGPLGAVINPGAIVEDFASTLRSELDFRNEAGALVRFERNLRSTPTNDRVVVPRPIAGLVSRRVLVMTFLRGTPIDEIDTLREQGHDLEEVLRCFVRAWMEGALVHGEFHGDVHAGNLFVTGSGEVAILDFGIMGQLDERIRRVLRATLPALLVERDFDRAVAAIFELGIAARTPDLGAAARDVEALVAPMLERNLADISYGEVLGQVLRIATRYQVRLPREFVLVVKQLAYFERYSKLLAPDYPLLADPSILIHLLDSGDQGHSG